MKRLLRKLAFWIVKEEITLAYCDGVGDGVNQMHYEPDTAEWMLITPGEYWGEQ